MRYSSYFVPAWTATFLPERSSGDLMLFGFPAATTSARCGFMYATAGNCFTRSGVMKMPLITTSQRFAPSAGSKPANELNTNFGLTPQSFAIAAAMSMSKPTGFPDVVVDSIGGNVGLSQYLKDPFTGELTATRWLAPAAATTTRKAVTKASRESTVGVRFIASSSPRLDLGRASWWKRSTLT